MMIKKGIARPVSKDEMLGLLEQADRQGLVLEPQNTLNLGSSRRGQLPSG